MTLPLALIVCQLAAASSAMAQEVWRCGAEGREFADRPCAQGRMLETPSPRPAADVKAAQSAAAREARLADAMRRERLAQEARQTGSGLTAIGPQAVKPLKPVRPKAPSKLRRPHPEDDGTWRAVAPGSRRTKG